VAPQLTHADPLHRAVELLREAIASTRDLVYDRKVRANTIEWFGEIDAILGFEPQGFPRTIEGWEAVLHPDDRQATLAEIRRALQSDEPFAVEYRVVTRAGDVRHWRERGRRLVDGAGVVTRVIGACTDVTDEVVARQALETRERLFRAVFENARDGLALIDDQYCYVKVNPAWARMIGHPVTAFPGVRMGQFAGSYQTLSPVDWNDLRRDGSLTAQLLLRAPGGDERCFDLSATAYVLPDRHLVLMRDVTDATHAAETLRRTQAQLRQSQKMEAIGQLAGGVAHDFNNILSVILGYADLIGEGLSPADPRAGALAEMRTAAERGAGLTRQLLAFSRKQVLQPKVLDLNGVVSRAETLLRRLIGEDIALTVRLDASAGTVRADPGQLEQVIMNLAVNARDAMPQGGRLVIETSGAELDRAPDDAGAAAAGRYAVLTVRDTGCGMDAAVTERVFEPFFTTKEAGRGTGLGLSTVYGIVTQSGGHIRVSSIPGAGTTFTIALPQIESAVDAPAAPANATVPAARQERILLVEDEAPVARLVERVLTDHGYQVVRTASAAEARAAVARERAFDLMLTDVVLPGLSGRALAEELGGALPGLRVLFMSGYTEDAIVRHGVDAQVEFLHKPFTVASLTRRVRDVLDARGTAGRPSQ
jgi:PAS domain S-box-containing protein